MKKIGYELEQSVGKIGTEESNFKFPQGVAIDPTTKNVYIVDEGNRKIIIYSQEGEYLFQFPKQSSYVLRGARGITINFERVFVTEEFRSTVSVFSLEGNFLTRFDGKTCRSKKCLNIPTGLTLAGDGSIFVCDCFNSKITLFTMEFIPQILAIDFGELELPKDVKIINETTLVVLDGGSECLTILNFETDNVIRKIVTNNKNGDVLNPIFFDVYLSEYFVISDFENDVIKVFSKKGKLLNVIGKCGDVFKSPTGVAVHDESHTLVSVSRKEDCPVQFFSLQAEA